MYTAYGWDALKLLRIATVREGQPLLMYLLFVMGCRKGIAPPGLFLQTINMQTINV